MSLLTDIAQYLEDNSVGTQGVDIFVGNLPDSEDNAILIEATGGVEPDRYTPIRKRTVQFTVRNLGYSDGLAKCEEIFALFHQKLENTVIGSQDLMISEALSEPTFIYRDESQRNLFTTNFIFQTRS